MADITITIKEDDRTTTIAGEGVATTETCGLPTLGAPDHMESFTRVDWATRGGVQYRLTVEYKEDHTNGQNQAPVGKADGAFPHPDHVLRLQGGPVGPAGDGAQGGDGAHDDAGAPAGVGGEGGRLASTLRELMERELQSREVIIVGSAPGVQIVGPPSIPLSEVDPRTQELVKRIKASQRRMAERREADEQK